MGIRRILIQVVFITAMTFPASAAGQEPPADSTSTKERFLLIPLRDPLAGYDANMMAWHSSVELLTAGGDALFRGTGLDNSAIGRSAHTALTLYLCWGMSYYSHEIAHAFLHKNRHRFWIDLSDWSYLVPRYIKHDLYDAWNREEYEYYRFRPYDSYILEWVTRSAEAGLYQNRLNSRFRARLATLSGSTAPSDGMAFCLNAIGEFSYILSLGDDPIGQKVTESGTYVDYNDVNGYVFYMDQLGVEISKDTWLAASGISAALSGQLWNSLYGAYRYIVHGDPATRNLELGLGGGISLAPPNFYLFPTVRGLYLEAETSLRGFFGPGDMTFVSIGSGLDALGLEKTGAVDRVRFGGMYHPAKEIFSFGISPFLYLDFTGSMKQIGHSVGLVVETPSYGRFFLTATFEHSRRDMIEQTVKLKDEGFYAIAGLGFRM